MPIKFVIVGKKQRSGPPSVIKSTRLAGLYALSISMVVGIGLPQMAEHMLRFRAPLFKIAMSRLRELNKILKDTPVFVFHYTDNAFLNAQTLTHSLEMMTR